MDKNLGTIKIGDQVFLEEGGEEFGAVREVRGKEITVYVENAGDFTVESAAVRSVHDGKVILSRARLDRTLREAIAHAHDREEPHA